jgi:hypothetical protein
MNNRDMALLSFAGGLGLLTVAAAMFFGVIQGIAAAGASLVLLSMVFANMPPPRDR